MTRRLATLLVSLWIAAALLAAVIAVDDPSLGWAAKSKPLVRWATPDGLVIALGPGEARTVETSFTSRKRIGHAQVTLSTNLSAYVSVSPIEFRQMRKGAPNSLELSVHVPTTAGGGDIPGTLTVTKIGRNGKPKRSSTLSVTLRVAGGNTLPPTITTTTTSSTLPSATTTTLPISLVYPTALLERADVHDVVLTQRLDGSLIANVPVSVLDRPSHDAFVIAVSRNTVNQTLDQWFASNVDPDDVLLPAHVFVESVEADGRTILAYQGPIPTGYVGEPLAGAYVMSPDRSIVVAFSLSEDRELGLTFSAEEQQQILEEMAASFAFHPAE